MWVRERLRLIGVNVDDLPFTWKHFSLHDTGYSSYSDKFTYTYTTDPITGAVTYTYSSGQTKTNIVEIDLAFSSNGTSAIVGTTTLSLPESILVSTLDTVRIPAKMSLTATAGPVPVNYNPTVDTLRASKIAPASLSNSLLAATNGIPETTKNFTVQFVSDSAAAASTTSSNSTKPDEVGHGLLRVNSAPVDVALDYTWRRIGGTDTGVLVLSNIPNDPTRPFNASLNGTYTLGFSGADTGLYTGTVDADTTSAADVSGKFTLQIGK